MKKLSLLSLLLLLACGRTIIEDTAPHFSTPIITAVNSTLAATVLKVKLNWAYPVAEQTIIQGFKIERSENNGDFAVVSDKIGTALRSFDFVETARSTSVIYRISTLYGVNSRTSLPVNYFVPAANLAATNCIVASGTLVNSSDEQPRVYISWNNTTLLPYYISSYQILRNTQAAPTPQIIGSTTNHFFVDDKVTAGTNYTYTVHPVGSNCAVNLVSISVISSPLGQCPTNLSAKIVEDSLGKSVILTWNAQVSDFSTFTVKRATTINGSFKTVSGSDWTGKTTVYQDRDSWVSGQAYYYKITSTVVSSPPISCESLIEKVQF